MNFEIIQKRMHPNAHLIQKGNEFAAGYDCFAIQDGTINPLKRARIPLGFASEFTPGYVGLLLDKGGMGNKGITRFAGVIDSDFRGEWEVILYNSNPEPFAWKIGQKIVQAVFLELAPATESKWADDLSVTARGEGKHGSTGITIEEDEKQTLIKLIGATGMRYATAYREWSHEDRASVKAWLAKPVGAEIPACMRKTDRATFPGVQTAHNDSGTLP